MKAESQFFFPSFTALILKLTGVILILGALTDDIILAIPPDFLNSAWLTQIITEWVNRGTIPLMGLALLFMGIWIERDRLDARNKNPRQGLLLGLVLFSALLGVIFLVLTPLYFNSSRLASAAKTHAVNDQATQAENQLDSVLEQQRSQVNALTANADKLAQLKDQIESTQIPDDQKTQLKQLQQTLQQVKDDPKLLDQKIAEARSQGLEKIQQQQQQAIDQVKTAVQKARIQAMFGSLSVAVGYFIIAWTGLGLSSQKRIRSRQKAR